MIYSLIVIYNKHINDSVTYNCIKDNQNVHIIIFDNSENNIFNKNFARKHRIEYYTENKNIGLSKAYNYVIKKINIINKNYLMILDDDTVITEEYLAEVHNKIEKSKCDILLPIVKSNDMILSPSNVQFGCRVKTIKNLSDIKLNKITAINSGMVIRTTVFNDLQYDEAMFLDYVDHMFMKRIREKKYNVYVMTSVINQNYSRNQEQTIDNLKFRYSIFKKDFKYYCMKCNRMFIYYIVILKLKIKYFIKYRLIF